MGLKACSYPRDQKPVRRVNPAQGISADAFGRAQELVIGSGHNPGPGHMAGRRPGFPSGTRAQSLIHSMGLWTEVLPPRVAQAVYFKLSPFLELLFRSQEDLT